VRIAVFVISLAEAEQRRLVITDYLSRLGLPWSFFDALRYPNTAHDKAYAGLTPGEVGCFLSHRAVWNHISTSDIDYAVILEDDTVLIPTLDYDALFASLHRFGVECIRLAVDRIEHAKPLVSLGTSIGMVSRLTAPRFGLGTAAYAITPHAARLLHSAASDIRTPVDLWLERYHNHRLPVFSLLPPCGVIMRSQPTTIEGRETAEPRSTGSYVFARATQALADIRDNWQLSKLDYALRRRADSVQPGAAHWPYSQLRRRVKRLLRLSP
jgi:glycosyl transferase family 25